MYTIFMTSSNSKTSDRHRLLFNLSDKINLKRSDKYVALSNLRIYYTWKNIKSHTKITNLKYQNKELALHDGSYSLSDIQNYFEYIKK